MGKREHYEPGTFSWVDLSTDDVGSSKAFYGELLGWEYEDNEIPGGGVYTMCRLQDDSVAAMMQQDEHPGHWNSYVTVASADETTAKAKQLGAHVFEEPFDVMDAGRMAVLADPTGAVLCVWEARNHIGAGRVNDPGCLSLNQLNTREPERATAFYADLFGWEIGQVVEDPPYWGINNNGWLNGGIKELSKGDTSTTSHWLVYFTTDDIDESASKITDLGGKITSPRMDIASGRILVAQDPQGATFALFEGRTDE